jgi:hypothetical protein
MLRSEPAGIGTRNLTLRMVADFSHEDTNYELRALYFVLCLLLVGAHAEWNQQSTKYKAQSTKHKAQVLVAMGLSIESNCLPVLPA